MLTDKTTGLERTRAGTIFTSINHQRTDENGRTTEIFRGNVACRVWRELTDVWFHSDYTNNRQGTDTFDQEQHLEHRSHVSVLCLDNNVHRQTAEKISSRLNAVDFADVLTGNYTGGRRGVAGPWRVDVCVVLIINSARVYRWETWTTRTWISSSDWAPNHPTSVPQSSTVTAAACR